MDQEALGPFEAIIPCVASILVGLVIRDGRASDMTMLAFGVLIWFGTAVALSTQDIFVQNPTEWNESDFPGFVTFAFAPFIPLVNFYILYQAIPALKEYILSKEPSQWISLQLYRLAGACFLYLYLNGTQTDYFSLQTGVLDIFMGVTAIPLARFVKTNGIKRTRTVVLIWHAIGLFDLIGGFAMVSANYFGYFAVVGQSLSYVAFYPISLIVLFQVPIAIGIHILFLTSIDQMISMEEEDKKGK